MYLVIAGGTPFAIEFGRLMLREDDNKVVLIIRKTEDAIWATQELGEVIVNADATNTATLDELELEKCDVFVSATGSEKDNILSAIYAKNAGVKRIFVVVDDPDAEGILRKLGFEPINAQHFAARAVELMVNRPAVSELVNIGAGKYDIIEVPAAETVLVGKEINQARGQYYIAIATYCKGNYDFSKQKKISSNEKIILLVTVGMEAKAEKEVSKGIKYKLHLSKGKR